MCCNYFYIRAKWPLTCIFARKKSAFAWGQANLKCKGIWWDEKCVAFRGSFKPEIVFIWSNNALNRSFCHFRCFGEEMKKRKHFGRFRSIKVKNSTKCERLVISGRWRRQGRGWQRQPLMRQRRFLAFYTRRRQEGHPRTLSGGEVTASRFMVTPSDPYFLYILFDFSFIVCNFVERKP